MSLGVLNNLNAMYAENSLNNTSNSLNTVLQQLSSGSKINSGADDAAGLSLVDGLQANSQALAQSQTNASEGVGLLKVADGALSQVTNLFNRAVTLATEASNGTLNSSQDAAANSEYQSILSEINNIGTTTTYNNQTVFGATQPVSIYTGDSSTAGASVYALNIGSLSSSNVGDTGGVMAYSNGSDNVFLNLSTSTTNAKATDNLSGSTSTMTVTYLVPGANGASTTATDNITVGQGTSYANHAQGLINAINNSGLGLSASFTTQANAGVEGGGTQTVNVDPSNATLSGLADAINKAAIGVTAVVDSKGTTLSFLSGTSGAPGTLAIDSSILDTTHTTTSSLGYTNSSDVSALANLGITMSTNYDGTINFDPTVLTSALNSDYSGVLGFFQNLNSWGRAFSTTLTSAGSSSSTGMLKLAATSNSGTESTLNANISREESMISIQQKSLTAELNSANEIMQALPSQLDGINQLYSAITGYNQNH